jgi:hypothetical protein
MSIGNQVYWITPPGKLPGLVKVIVKSKGTLEWPVQKGEEENQLWV